MRLLTSRSQIRALLGAFSSEGRRFCSAAWLSWLLCAQQPCADTVAVRAHRELLANIQICRDPGSNWGPPDLQSDALPTELSRLMNYFCDDKHVQLEQAQDTCPASRQRSLPVVAARAREANAPSQHLSSLHLWSLSPSLARLAADVPSHATSS